jgi:hypothetical protein
VRLALRNQADQALGARVLVGVGAAGAEAAQASQAHSVRVPARGRCDLALPVSLRAPGPATIELSIAPDKGAPLHLSLPVSVPAPATAVQRLFLADRRGLVRVPIELNVAPESAAVYTLAARLEVAGQLHWQGRIRCVPGQQARLEGMARVPRQLGWLDLSLEDPQGKEVWRARLPIMPALDFFAEA